MDAKANTHLCISPVVETDAEKTAAPPHSAYMLVVSGGIPGTMVRLSEQRTSLGRSAQSSFQISDITVSRDHAVVTIDEMGSVQVRDVGSTNGTFLNGKRVHVHRPVKLADGDRGFSWEPTSSSSWYVSTPIRRAISAHEMFERTVRP